MVYNRVTRFLDCDRRPENTTFRKLDLLLSLGEGREIPTLLSPLEGANFSHIITHSNHR
jgi:hypothetical protein